MQVTIHTTNELHDWVYSFVHTLNQRNQATIVTLSGDLGAGKTTCVQYIARVLGIEEPITSPTFVIQKEYPVFGHDWITRLVHIDAYRLEDKNQLEYLGWQHLVDDPHTLICIEWPEMVSGIAIPDALQITFSLQDSNTRLLTVV